ncbi:14655_t:CDS:2, partial [Ambispora leptoticha]
KIPNLNPDECCEQCGASCIVYKTKTSYTIKRKREFREANQQTCPQCKKREFPHMKREQAQRLTQVEMFPPELNVELNPTPSNSKYSRELQQRLNNQSNLTPEERQQSNYLRNLQQNTLQNAENSYKNKYGSLVEDKPKGSDNKGKGIEESRVKNTKSMNNRQIINYIKVREAWRDALRAKSNALSSIWSGLFRFGSFLAYYALEKYFLHEEIAKLYEHNPNYKYIFYLSLAFG